jgi:hypothetical protein
VLTPTRPPRRRKRRAAIFKLVSSKGESRKDFELSLDDIAREGARPLLVHCLNLEVEEYINQNREAVDSDGRRLVVKNGVSRPRQVTMGSGTVEVRWFKTLDKPSPLPVRL